MEKAKISESVTCFKRNNVLLKYDLIIGLTFFHLEVFFNSSKASFLQLGEGSFNKALNILSASESMNVYMLPNVSLSWILGPVSSGPKWHAARYAFIRLSKADSLCSSLTCLRHILIVEHVSNLRVGLAESSNTIRSSSSSEYC